MKKLIISALMIILALSMAVTAGMLIPANDKAKENSPVIGENGDLDRVDFIHYAKSTSPAKIPSTNCYKLLGVKWTTNLPVSYVINPTGSGLDGGFVTSKVSTAAETWDSVTSKVLFGASAIDLVAYYGKRDYKNAIAFGNYPDSNVIAVTSIWYTRVGKQIVEFDMLFDTDYTWGEVTPTNQGIMDLQNIAIHELGHAVGLGDIYSTACSEVTMYGYSTEGETKKISLETADVTGLQKIYGI